MKVWMIAPVMALLVTACGEAGEGASQSPAEAPLAEAAAGPTEAAVAPGLTGFEHKAGEDLFGYYMPTQAVQVGDYRLDHIHIGDAAAFSAWEAGDRTETYAPVMLEFSDVTSPKMTNELGQEYHANTIRLLPTAYKLGEGDFRFVGSHPDIGLVVIDGMLDLDQLAAERASNGLPETEAAALLRTSAQIGPEAYRNLSFYWFGGD